MKLTKLFKQFISEAKSLNEEDQTFKVSMPDGFDLDWTVEDFETVDGTIAKKFIYDLTITAPDSSVKGTSNGTLASMTFSNKTEPAASRTRNHTPSEDTS